MLSLNQENQQKPKGKFHYYNSKFPKFLQESYESDIQYLTKEIEDDFYKYSQPNKPNVERLISRLISKLEIAHKSYRLPHAQREIYCTILLRLVFEEHTNSYEKVILLKEFNSLSGRKKLKHIRLDWKPFLDILDKNYFKSWDINVARGHGDRFSDELFKFLSRGKRYFIGEEGINDLLKHFRKNINPNEIQLTKALCYLKLFFHPSNKHKQGYYDKWFQELFEIWSWKFNSFWDKIFLVLFSRLAKEHYEIDWSPYYEFLFTTFFKAVKNELPKKNYNQIENSLEYNIKLNKLFKDTHTTDYVIIFLANMIRPAHFPYALKFWENFERLINFTINFIHPQNNGSWNVSLAQFYNTFSREYLKRYKREVQIKETHERRLAKLNAKEGGEQSNGTTTTTAAGTNNNNNANDDNDIDYEDEDDESSDNEGNEDNVEDVKGEAGAKTKEKYAKYENNKEYFLDEDCNDRFFTITKNVLNYLIYSSDDSVNNQVAKLCRRMMYFRPEKMADFILEKVYQILDRIDVSHIGVLKIIAYISTPLLTRKNYMKGIYELPKLLEKTIDHITPSDPKKTEVILEIYEKIFSMVPIFEQSDLKKKLKEFSISNIEDISEEYNEKLNDLCEDISDFARKLFDKIVDILPFIEKNKAKDEKSYRVLMINPKNKFHSIINQSSEKLIEFYTNRFCEYLYENVEKTPNKNVSDIIQALNLKNPHFTIKKVLNILKGKILSKKHSSDNSQNTLKSPLIEFAFKNSFSGLTAFNYEPRVTKDSLIWYLSLVEDCVSFSQDATIEYKTDLEHILFNCLVHEENEVYEKAAQVYQKLILSLLNVYPINLGSLNPEDMTTKEKFLSLYQNIGKVPGKDINLEWHLPTDKEIDYADYLVEMFLRGSMKYVRETILGDDIKRKKFNQANCELYVDYMHLLNNEISMIQKKDLSRIMNLISQIFGAINQRSSFKDMIELNDIQINFEKKFCIEKFANVRKEIIEFIEDIFVYIINNGLAHDQNLIKIIHRLIADVCGEDDHNEYMLSTNSFIKHYAKAFSIPGERRLIDNRFVLATKINLEVQKRILSYNFENQFSDKIGNIVHILWVFLHNSHEKIRHKSATLLEKLIGNTKDRYEQNSSILTRTLNAILMRFQYIREKFTTLEETGEIIMNSDEKLKLTKANRENYQESLLRAISKVLGFALDSNTFGKNSALVLFAVKSLADLYLMVDDKLHNRIITQLLILLRTIDFAQFNFDENREHKSKKPIFLKVSEKYKLFESKYPTTMETNPKDHDHVEMDGISKLRDSAKKLKPLTHIINSYISDEKIPWKLRTTLLIFSVALAYLLDPSSPEFESIIQNCVEQLDQDHYFLRQFGIACLPILLRLHMNHKFPKDSRFITRTEEDFKSMKKSLEDLLKSHFILPEDLEKGINDPFIGFYDTYTEIKINPIIDYEKYGNDNVSSAIMQKAFLEKFFVKLMNDFSAKEDVGIQQMQQGFQTAPYQDLASNLQLLLNVVFSKGKMTTGGLNKANLYSYIVARFFKRLFHNYGPKMFDITIEFIEESAQDTNSKEKQALAINYFSGLLKAVRFWPEDKRETALVRVSKMFTHAMLNTSLEIFHCWLLAFGNAVKICDHRVFDPLFKIILKNPLEAKATNIQGRYLALYSTVLKAHSYHVRHIANQLIQEIIKVDPTDMRQASEIALAMIPCLKTVLTPLNYRKIKEDGIINDIDTKINQEGSRFLVVKDMLLYEIDPLFKSVLDNFVKLNVEANTLDKRKICIQSLFSVLFILQRDTMNQPTILYYREVLQFLLSLDIDSHTLDADTQKSYKTTLGFLSKIIYPKEGLGLILPILEKNFNHSSYRVRENAASFYEYLFFNHIFYLHDSKNLLLNGSLTDENNNVRNTAFNALVEIIRILTNKEIHDLITKMITIVESKEKTERERSDALIALMAIVLGSPYEIEPWTENALKAILKYKKLSKIVQEKVKDFFSRFWKTQKQSWHLNGINLSEDTLDRIKEISNPFSYFA